MKFPMHQLAVIAGLLFAQAAMACVCMGPLTPEQERETATRIATNASAIAEIEQIEPMDYQAMRSELYRVVKIHLGQAPSEFRLARNFRRNAKGNVEMNMTSCDVVPPPNQRTLVILYKSKTPESYSIGGTCDQIFINSERGLRLVLEAAGKSGERG
jgi:hypothetical protein